MFTATNIVSLLLITLFSFLFLNHHAIIVRLFEALCSFALEQDIEKVGLYGDDIYAAYLEKKYKPQAKTYDASRTSMLPGRETLIGLLAARIKQKMADEPTMNRQKLIWVDVSDAHPLLSPSLSPYIH